MSDRDDGGPAFPHVTRQVRGNVTEQITDGGMSLRDWFAGQALKGYLSSGRWPEIPMDWDDARLAAECYAIADAMLRERDR